MSRVEVATRASNPSDAELEDHVRRTLRAAHGLVRCGRFSFRFERRPLLVSAIVVVVALAAGIGGMLVGDYAITVRDVVASFFGSVTDPLGQYFVTQVRLPRIVAALAVGAALGVSGAIFQTISGNPLGSPDIIGFTTGAATGALLQIIVVGGATGAVAIGALVGGMVTALVVYGLSWRGGVAGFRLVLVGIGTSAVLAAINSLLVVKAPLDSAQRAASWLTGSLNAVLWPQVALLGVSLAVLVPLAAAQFRTLGSFPLGDAVATSIGVRVERSRFVLVIVGVALMAVATATTGPIAFVALAAPHLFRKLSGTSGVGLAGAAVTGACLVVISDLIGRRLFAPVEMEVGVVTGAVGGLYLVYLLIVERQRF